MNRTPNITFVLSCFNPYFTTCFEFTVPFLTHFVYECQMRFRRKTKGVISLDKMTKSLFLLLSALTWLRSDFIAEKFISKTTVCQWDLLKLNSLFSARTHNRLIFSLSNSWVRVRLLRYTTINRSWNRVKKMPSDLSQWDNLQEKQNYRDFDFLDLSKFGPWLLKPPQQNYWTVPWWKETTTGKTLGPCPGQFPKAAELV